MQRYHNKKVLLAEDNEINMDIMVELLTSVGLDVDCASNGKIALEQYINHDARTYDLILLDIQMPLMDGYEVARSIRMSTQSDSKSIPIYAMTANAFLEDVNLAKAAGMTGHITKPIDTKLLFDIISKHIQS